MTTTASSPPGSFCARNFKMLKCLLKVVWDVDKVMVLKEIFTKAKKLKKLPTKSGEVAVITGAARGIGLEVLKKLLECDFKVIIGIRDLSAGEQAVKKIRENGVSTGSVVLLNLDLKSLKSVRSFAAKVLKETQRIDLLFNNAGIMVPPFEVTEDGFESQFQVNYLGHFLLTNLLLPRIKETATKRETCCRIINTSSDANYGGAFDFTDLENCKVYDRVKSYCDSKFAQILHAKYLDWQMRMEGCQIRAYSLHPGAIYTNLWSNLGSFINYLGSCVEMLFKTAEDAANGIIYVALSTELEMDGGGYFNNCEKVRPNPRAEDFNLQKLLWERSIQLSTQRP